MHRIWTNDNFRKSYVRVSLLFINLSRIEWVAYRRWDNNLSCEEKAALWEFIIDVKIRFGSQMIWLQSDLSTYMDPDLTTVLNSKYWKRSGHSLIQLHRWKFHLKFNRILNLYREKITCTPDQTNLTNLFLPLKGPLQYMVMSLLLDPFTGNLVMSND